MDTCPTVKIKSAGKSGFAEINESDFDPSKHERFEAPPAPVVEPPPAPVSVPPPPIARETLKLKGRS